MQTQKKFFKSTATEHAKKRNASSSASKCGGKGDRRVKAKVEAHDDDSQGTATEHAKQRQSMTWRYNSQTQDEMEEAQIERANHTLEHLVIKLAEFLTYLLRELCCSPRLEADFEEIVFEKIGQWARQAPWRHFYGESELLLHNKMWDIMTRDRDGLRKNHSFADWCRRIAMHSTGSSGASSAATEHAERDDPFRKLAEDISTHELTP